MKKFSALLLFLCLIVTTALADTTLTGTVVSGGTVTVLAPTDGTLASVDVQAGDRVTLGETVATLTTTTIYANEAGTVHIFGTEGASLEAIADAFGAVLYIEPDAPYSIAASTKYTYDADANKRIVPGETVYLKCATDGKHTGKGYVTGVNGSDYLIAVTNGSFADDETVLVYRSADYTASSRVGRGTVTRTGAVGYTGTGEAVSISSSSSASNMSRTSTSTATATETTAADTASACSLVKLLVTDGQEVFPGTPLFTVSTASAYAQTMTAPADGVVTEVAATAGTAVTENAAIVTIAPNSMMRLALHVPEDDLAHVTLGSQVTIQFLSGETAKGTIISLQGLAEETADTEDAADEETCFTVYVTFSATPTIAYGMTGKVVIAD